MHDTKYYANNTGGVTNKSQSGCWCEEKKNQSFIKGSCSFCGQYLKCHVKKVV